MTQIAHRYALALFRLAREAKKADVVGEDLIRLRALARESDELTHLMVSRRFGRRAQAAVLEDICAQMKVDGLTKKFLMVLSLQGRLKELKLIISEFEAFAAAASGVLQARVTTAAPLESAEHKSLTADLEKALKKKVTVSAVVDESLIGGMRLRLGSVLVDGSFKAKLDQLHQAMRGV